MLSFRLHFLSPAGNLFSVDAKGYAVAARFIRNAYKTGNAFIGSAVL